MTSPPNSGTTGPTDPPPAPGPPTRSSDADREAAVRVLHDAVGRGLLTLEEGDERVAAAYAARFLQDLPPLTADLPPAPAPAPLAPGWRALAVLAWLQLRTALAALSWRGVVRSKPRLVVAVIAVLAVLSLAAVTAGEVGDHGDEEGHVEHFEPR
jgi:hypothetical protein